MNKKQRFRVKKVGELYRQFLFSFENSPKTPLVWHHQNKTSTGNKKVSQASSCKKAFKEIREGKCIPLTEEEHKLMHSGEKSQNWEPCHFPKGSKRPKYKKRILIYQNQTNLAKLNHLLTKTTTS